MSPGQEAKAPSACEEPRTADEPAVHPAVHKQRRPSLPRVPSYVLLEAFCTDGQTSGSSAPSAAPESAFIDCSTASVIEPAEAEPPATVPRDSDGDSFKKSLQHPAHDPKANYQWLQKRLCDGEAATLLSLSGNFAVALVPSKVGTTIDYTVRDRVRIPGRDKFALVQLTDKFVYKVQGVYGDLKGRAIVVMPEAYPRTYYVAFRGMRNKSHIPEEDIGPQHDRDNFSLAEPAHAEWLPDGEMRVHEGVLDHHRSLWNLAGLRGFMVSLAMRARQGFPPAELLFVGLSMGGALAELTAYRVGTEFPELRSCMRVLSFGSIPWANPPVASDYDRIFGRGSVQLVLSRRDVGPAPPNAGWWVAEPAARWELIRTIFCKSRQAEAEEDPHHPRPCPSYIVFDPLVASCDSSFCLLENVLACSQEANTVDARATALLGLVRGDEARLAPRLAPTPRPNACLARD